MLASALSYLDPVCVCRGRRLTSTDTLQLFKQFKLVSLASYIITNAQHNTFHVTFTKCWPITNHFTTRMLQTRITCTANDTATTWWQRHWSDPRPPPRMLYFTFVLGIRLGLKQRVDWGHELLRGRWTQLVSNATEARGHNTSSAYWMKVAVK
jgi:hypothetical protein